MSTIITGTRAPVRQRDRITYDPKNGIERQIVWQCPDPNGLYSIAASFEKLGYKYTFEPGLNGTIVASAPSADDGQDETVTDTWEITANELQKDIREHWKFRQLSDSVQSSINANIKESAELSTISPPLTGNAVSFYKLMKSGTTHYAVSQFVLKHTTNVSDRYQTNVSDKNVEKLYTFDQLIAEASDASLWVNPIPGRLKAKLLSIKANYTPTAVDGYSWGWRKLASTERSNAKGRIDIQTEYWLEQWSSTLYEAV
jgi:hypothetical protein